MSTYQIIGLIYALVAGISILVLAIEANRRRTLQLEYLPNTTIFTWIIRVMIGGLFIYSGFVKANDYMGFALKLEEYFMVFGEHFPAFKGFFDLLLPTAEPQAWFISVFEIALGVALLVGFRMPLTVWLSLLMMVFFTILTGYSHFTGAVTDCGCFGDALKIEPWETFVKDIILSLMLIPLFVTRKQIPPFPSKAVANWATGITFVFFGIFSWWCHEHLPLIDYRPYKLGTDLEVCTTQMTAAGYPKCKDWYPYFPEEEIPLFEGKVLMIIYASVDKAPAEEMKATAALADQLAGSDITVVGATATGPSQMETFISQYGLDYPLAFMDETVLKTIIRSHPGYMLLQDGVVMGKWHYNDRPDLAELKAAMQ
jgi:uncharacterized membrane protein YphA (DoxX/SURF4 family)